MVPFRIPMAGRFSPEQIEALRPLLDVIYKGEGGYTSVNRGKAGDTPGGALDLVKLTIGQVKAHQRAEKWHAVGAPQIIPETLKIAQADAGLKDSDLFSPAHQDQLAAALLLGSKRPKLASYLKGKTSALATAQTELAHEWASIPLPSGRGAYDGDEAGNRATAEVQAVQAALVAARRRLAGIGDAPPALDAPSITLEQQPPAAPKAAAKPRDARILTITALQDTWLKKQSIPADELGEKERVAVEAGKTYGVVAVRELPRTAHVEVEIAAGAGTWVIWQPHWKGFSELPTSSGRSGLIDWSDFSAAVTPHLTVGEVLQFDHRRRPSAGSGDIGRILHTARAFEAVRNGWGGPLGITSFYRPEPINTAVGGVSNSQHVPGNAFDLYPIGGRSLEDFYQWIRTRWTGGLGDGRNRGFIHLDTRSGGGFVPGAGRRPAVEWTY